LVLGLVTTFLFLGILLLANTLFHTGYWQVVINNAWLILVITFVSPLLMDLDHQSSKLRQVLLGTGLVSLAAGVIIGFFNDNTLNYIIFFSTTFLLIVFFIAVFFKHRGFTHSWSFIILVSLILGLMSGEWVVAGLNVLLMWGHLIGDKIPFKIM